MSSWWLSLATAAVLIFHRNSRSPLSVSCQIMAATRMDMQSRLQQWNNVIKQMINFPSLRRLHYFWNTPKSRPAGTVSLLDWAAALPGRASLSCAMSSYKRPAGLSDLNLDAAGPAAPARPVAISRPAREKVFASLASKEPVGSIITLNSSFFSRFMNKKCGDNFLSLENMPASSKSIARCLNKQAAGRRNRCLLAGLLFSNS